jgi:DNA-binding NtrC family response regulator
MKVLIIDDEPGIVIMLSEWLTAKGHEPVGITHGAHMKSWLQSRHFDLVLTDILMPGYDGLLAAYDIVEAGIKVVVMSGLPEELWVARALIDGVYDCLPKPVSFEKLELILGRLELTHSYMHEPPVAHLD